MASLKMENREHVLRRTTIQQLVAGGRRLVEVPYTASVGDTLHTLLAHGVLAVPVAAPPGHWIGAGGSMILESDKVTGTARKHYIGMVSVKDILIYLAEALDVQDAARILAVQVSTIIGNCIEGLSLWAISPQTSVLDALDSMSKGIHRALVPFESQMEHASGIGLEEVSPGYRMISQTDLIHFLWAESSNLQPLLSQSIESLGALQSTVFAVPASMSLIDTLKCMKEASLSAVVILEPSDTSTKLQVANGKKLMASFSASDLRGCSAETLQSWSKLSVLEFLKKSSYAKLFAVGSAVVDSDVVQQVEKMGDHPLFEQVTCSLSSSLGEVIAEALNFKKHRVWVVNDDNCLAGLVTFTDILKAVWKFMEDSHRVL